VTATPPAPAWTSDLSVAEAAAVRRVGLVPAGFVMGTAVMQLVAGGGPLAGSWSVPGLGGGLGAGPRGYEAFPCAHGFGLVGSAAEHYGFNVEDAVFEASLTQGYTTAIERLGDEAAALGAHGVVGVELFYENLVGSMGTATFFARGTAVVHRGSEALAVPFVTNASGQHFERLVAQGYIPAGLAVGVGAVYVQPNCQARGDMTVVGPVRQLPRAIAIARGRARAELAARAHRLGEGVVHTDWRDSRLPRYGESFDQLTVAVGTAVRRFQDRPGPQAPRPVLPLRP